MAILSANRKKEQGILTVAGPLSYFKDEGHFLFCANEGYAQHMAACIVSMLENSSLKHHNILVVGQFGPEVRSQIEEICEGNLNATIKLREFIAPDTLYLPTRIHYTKDVYTRLWVAGFFSEDVQRVIYLDSDIIVTGDIGELWRTDMDGKMIGTADIPGADQNARLDIPPEYNYFNSGVILFDLAAWRQLDAEKFIFDYIQVNPDKLIEPDQDALNACFFAQRYTLDISWNVITPFTWPQNELPYSSTECAQIVKSANIVHFNGQSKPWHYLNRHPWKDEYWKYIRKTPWRNAKEQGITLLNRIKKLYDVIVPRRAKVAIGNFRFN